MLSGGSITAPSWNGITGGIVAVSVSGTCTLNGDIDVSGKGFRGGVRDNNTSGTGTIVSDFISNSSFIGAEKGESIVGYHAEYDALGGRYGRGAPANGGGLDCLSRILSGRLELATLPMKSRDILSNSTTPKFRE